MGSCNSAEKATEIMSSDKSPGTTEQGNDKIADFELKKRRPGCTGMFWREDPTKQERLTGNQNWPKDNAILRGETVFHNGKKWLKAYKVKQAGDTSWKDAPAGAFMPFEYDDHYYLDPVLSSSSEA